MRCKLIYRNLGVITTAAIFLLVNAGFTSVLHSCLMENKACCVAMSIGGMIDGDKAAPSGSTSFSRHGSTCCENAIVGGLTGISALSQSQDRTEAQKSILLHLITGVLSPVIPPVVPTPHDITRQYSASPPSRAIYILTSVLLI